MRDEQHNFGGLREVRLRDPRLSRLHDEDSRFRCAAQLVAFFAKRSGAQVISWCLEDHEEVIILAEGGELSEQEQAAGPLTERRRDQLLAEATSELIRAHQYRRASDAAKDPYTALGYLDMAREAQAAAMLLTKKAQGD